MRPDRPEDERFESLFRDPSVLIAAGSNLRRPISRTVAFVSHYDCARHDTGWSHPDHQGRLPAVMRAVYRDMLTLHGHLVEVEGRHATIEELRLVHTEAHLEKVAGWVRSAAERASPIEVEPGLMVSEASWDAARAAVGSVLTAIDRVAAGETTSAFSASRPPGAGAAADAAGGFSLLNSVAVGARYLLDRGPAERVLVVEWVGGGRSALGSVFDGAADVGVATFGALEVAGGAEARVAPHPLTPDDLGEALIRIESHRRPDFVILAAGFDVLAADPVGKLSLLPADVFDLTCVLRDWADRVCGGRLVSVLEGGYATAELGEAVVQHLRALADLPRAA